MKKSTLALAVATAMGASVANAAIVTGLVVSSQRYGLGTIGVNDMDISGATATYSYDTVTGVLKGSGLHNAVSALSPTSIVFSHNVLNLSISNTAASATSFSCVEGNVGVTENANVCGNYTFGPNNVDEGASGNGDDLSAGPAQSVMEYDLPVVSWNGTTLILSDLKNTVYVPGVVTLDTGIELTLTAAVPIPPVIWLFGSGVVLGLGWMRRLSNIRD